MVSILDWAFMGRTLPDWKSALALFGILSSGSMYARLKIADPGFDANGTTQIVDYGGPRSGWFPSCWTWCTLNT